MRITSNLNLIDHSAGPFNQLIIIGLIKKKCIKPRCIIYHFNLISPILSINHAKTRNTSQPNQCRSLKLGLVGEKCTLTCFLERVERQKKSTTNMFHIKFSYGSPSKQIISWKICKTAGFPPNINYLHLTTCVGGLKIK